jgi:predicted double-glycine peptidase
VISVLWFILLAAFSAGGFALGRRIARAEPWHGRLWLIAGMTLLGLWAWLFHRPDVAIRLIPVGVLSYLEGTAAAPIFMLILGIAWERSKNGRQKGVTAAAILVGVFYFMHGGLWMLQTTPVGGFTRSARANVVMQSSSFSCVPASCATALNLMGLPSTEAQMAELTQTRPNSGATLIRAVDGLRRRLNGSDVGVELVQSTYDQLTQMPKPALTALSFEPTRRHMVVVTRATDRGAWVIDPMDGTLWMPRSEFEPLYNGEVIVFRQ